MATRINAKTQVVKFYRVKDGTGRILLGFQPGTGRFLSRAKGKYFHKNQIAHLDEVPEKELTIEQAWEIWGSKTHGKYQHLGHPDGVPNESDWDFPAW